MKKIMVLLLIVLMVLGGFAGYRLRPGEFRVNPRVKVDPKRDYTLQVWISRPSIPDPVALMEGIEQVITNFTSANPHIGIDTYLVPLDILHDKLSTAQQLGEPPDLLLDASTMQCYYGDLQVPFGLYMSKEEKAAWPAGILAQMTEKGEIWGQPVAATTQVFMANRTLLGAADVDYEGLIEKGWTWQQFLSVVGLASSTSHHGLVMTNPGTPLLQVLAASLGKPAPMDSSLQVAWSTEDLVTMANTWEQIKTATGVPTGSKLVDDCIGAFLKKRATIIGPLNPFLTGWLWAESINQGISPVLLPAPSLTTPVMANLAVVPVVLFRQVEYQGHDHTAAAALFGRTMAVELAPLLSKHLGLVPLSPPEAPDLSMLPFDDASKRAYAPLDKVVPTPYAYGPAPGWTASQWSDVLAPAWEDLVSGKLTSTDFAQAVLESLLSQSTQR